MRCQYRGAHVGIALAKDDPRAWIARVAFPMSSVAHPPSRKDVSAHVAWCDSQGLLQHKQPVLWPWGVMWDADLFAVR